MPSRERLEALTPTILCDSREQRPLSFNFPTITRGLPEGDYSILGAEHLFAVERKSIPDLVGCVAQDRERFEAQLRRLRGYPFARLLIVGAREDIVLRRYRSNVSPQSILGTLAAFEVRYVPVVWASNEHEAARMIEGWAHYFVRGALKTAKAITTLPETADAS